MKGDPLSKTDSKLFPVLARCLSGPVLRQIHEEGHSPYLEATFREAHLDEALGLPTTLAEASQAIFQAMCRRYRSDYVYRVAVARKLFLGRHSPTTTTFLSELRVGQCRADVVMLNGTSTAYEIKSELDRLDRLDSQIQAYQRMFDRTYVVTHQGEVAKLEQTLPPAVGILVLKPTLRLRTVREAASNAAQTDIFTMVDALRSKEVADLTKQLCGTIPPVGNVELVGECRQQLLAHPPKTVHDAMVAILKKRRRRSSKDFEGVPTSLLPAYLESGLKPDSWQGVTRSLTATTIGDVLSGTWPSIIRTFEPDVTKF